MEVVMAHVLARAEEAFPCGGFQVRLSAAKIGAEIGAAHEETRIDGICVCIDRQADQRARGLAREDVRQSA